jgi:GNAT superfamily N-acetyltransferase
VQLLDQDLLVRDGTEQGFYAQFNKLDNIRHTVVAYEGTKPVACGAIKEFSPQLMEVKRMFVHPAHRGRGIAQAILAELERWAKELRYTGCVLETGKRQPEAIGLYQKCSYALIPNYGQYIGVENSVCMQKQLS